MLKWMNDDIVGEWDVRSDKEGQNNIEGIRSSRSN
jgi:hypothetical protein